MRSLCETADPDPKTCARHWRPWLLINKGAQFCDILRCAVQCSMVQLASSKTLRAFFKCSSEPCECSRACFIVTFSWFNRPSIFGSAILGRSPWRIVINPINCNCCMASQLAFQPHIAPSIPVQTVWGFRCHAIALDQIIRRSRISSDIFRGEI